MYIEDDQIKFSGVGIGDMWFYLGSNSYFRWSSGTGSKVYKEMAIGRMVDIPQ